MEEEFQDRVVLAKEEILFSIQEAKVVEWTHSEKLTRKQEKLSSPSKGSAKRQLTHELDQLEVASMMNLSTISCSKR